MPDRDEFERRLLALVRDYMDDADEIYPEGYEIGDFMVFYEVYTREEDSEQLPPWSGGVRAGWNSPSIAFSSTTTEYWLDEAWLVEALKRVRKQRLERESEHDADEEQTD
jgi:hypothetical protein